MKEKLPLAAFTLLAQAGLGLAVVAALLGLGGARPEVVNLVSMGLTVLSLLAAFGHLGQPLGAHRTLRNLGRSWLSRECVLLGAFLALGGLRLWVGTGAGFLPWASALLGGAGLYSMAAVYGRTAMPAWKGWHVHLSFHTAAGALGAMLLAALGAGRSGITPALGLAGGMVLAQLVGWAAHLAGKGAGAGAGRGGLGLLAGGLALTAAGGLALPALAAGGTLVPALAVLAVGQAMVRYAFYASGVHAMEVGWNDIPYANTPRDRG
jgi:anaerobic dimethyl sulfoxide reductase subunit C (anchor subunit)